MAHICTITELNEYIKSMFDRDSALNGVYVKGEISNYKFHSSGHHYMTLKDESSVIRAVMFKYDAMKLKFRPESGMKIIAKGRISVFPRDGQYQLYISDMMPDGVGALYVAFEQLKKRLSEEGLFDPQYKKTLPKYPQKIALVTSPTGAAVRDMLRILKARFPLSSVIVCPVLVQGEGAPEDIAGMISYVNKHKLSDLMIIGRGGGSIEDLWGFNDERVARAVFASEIPVISAVGHEPDVTISDFVADVRAATPSNAAEIAVPDAQSIRCNIKEMESRTSFSLTSKLEFYKKALRSAAEKRVMQDPRNYFLERRLALDFMSEKVASSTKRSLSASREKFVKLVASVDAMSPLKVLSRGYSIATTDSGKVIKRLCDANKGDKFSLRVEDGNISCTVDGKEEV